MEVSDMSIQVRYKMNTMETRQGDAPKPDESEVFAPYADEPVIDFRDSGTVWIWLHNDLCVEITRGLAERIVEGFKEQVELEEEDEPPLEE